MRIALPLICLAIGIGISSAKAPLDTSAIRQIYLDGDFEDAIERLELARKYGGPFSHADSVFLLKHLGVMYSAKYETRELGKKFLMQLLYVEPSARIMDMYASDMIYMIFKNIRDEFELSRAKFGSADQQLQDGPSASDTLRTESGKKDGRAKLPHKRSYAWIGWTAGALATAGGVAVLVQMQKQDPKPRQDEHIIP